MADTHPYISGVGNVEKMINQLRKTFPQVVTSETVKKLGLASNNESYLINVLQFIGLIDEEGNRTEEGAEVFSHHTDESFAKAFGELVKKSYHSLFDLHDEHAWDLEIDDLITFFRKNDKTSDAIGQRQAKTFKILAGLSGHGELITAVKSTKSKQSKVQATPKKKTKVVNSSKSSPLKGGEDKSAARSVGLTVRVEVNLPADGTKEIYDNIFKSIKENLIDG